MNQPPAYQHYADVYAAGTSDMTAEEVGVYQRLLNHSWSKNGLKNDVRRLALVVGKCHADAEATVADVLQMKFYLDPDGIWRNERQELERAKQIAYHEGQSNKAKAMWEKKRLKNITGPSTPKALPAPSGAPPETSPSAVDSAASLAVARPGTTAFANIPTWEEVKAMAPRAGATEQEARAFFDHHDSKNLWLNGHGRMINVQPSLAIWVQRGRTMVANGASGAGAKSVRARHVPTLKQVQDFCRERADSFADATAATSFGASWFTHWNLPKRNWMKAGKPLDWSSELQIQIAQQRKV